MFCSVFALIDFYEFPEKPLEEEENSILSLSMLKRYEALINSLEKSRLLFLSFIEAHQYYIMLLYISAICHTIAI